MVEVVIVVKVLVMVGWAVGRVGVVVVLVVLGSCGERVFCSCGDVNSGGSEGGGKSWCGLGVGCGVVVMLVVV